MSKQDLLATQASNDGLANGGGAALLLKSKRRQNEGSIFLNINEYVNSRLLADMLERKVLPSCRESKNYVILVMDDAAARVVSNYCNMFDLMEAGNIY